MTNSTSRFSAGIVVEEGELGSQIQNRAVALQRLRLLLERQRGG